MEISICAVKAIIELEGKILLLQRSKELRGEDNWDLPGGLIKTEESETNALHREVMEELQIKIEIIKPLGQWSFIRTGDKEHVSAQNYLCKIIDENFEIKLSDEHSAYKWITPKEIIHFALKDSSLKDEILKLDI